MTSSSLAVQQVPSHRSGRSQLPAELIASVFVALHMPPLGCSVLRTVTAAISHLPVQQAEDGMLVEPGHIYLAVPDCHLLLVDTGVICQGRGPRENMAWPAIDALFRSAKAHCCPGKFELNSPKCWIMSPSRRRLDVARSAQNVRMDGPEGERSESPSDLKNP